MKKEHKDPYLALIHFSIAGVAMPLLIFLAYGFVAPFLGIAVFEPSMWILEEALYFLGLWLGVRYGAKILAKKYVVPDVAKLALLATLYLGLFSIAFMIFGLFSKPFTIVGFIIDVALVATELALFYFLTKRYVQVSAQV